MLPKAHLSLHSRMSGSRELKEAQQAQSPKDGHSVPGVFDTPTGLRNAKCLVGGKSAKSSSFTSGQTSP